MRVKRSLRVSRLAPEVQHWRHAAQAVRVFTGTISDAPDICQHRLSTRFSQSWAEDVEKEYNQRHDTSTAALVVDLDKCIKCGRCVTACNSVQVRLY